MVTTTKASLATRMKQIPIEVLPKTFRDAVTFTRELGIQYLWIDALCILQDDEDDWEKESSKMASIYQNSYLTIAATASNASNKRCFRPSKPSVIFKFANTAPNPPSSTIGSTDMLLYPETCISRAFLFDDAPLNTRAWTLQEMLLSCRTINFTKDQVFWHCLSELPPRMGQ